MDPLLVTYARAVATPRNVIDVPVADGDECAGWAARVEALRAHWRPRNGEGFYTLGCATYLDVCNSDTPDLDYYDRLRDSNALLDAEFGDLLERVRDALERTLGRPARFVLGLARPGFHVFERDGIAVHAGANAHFDLQHQRLRFPRPIREDEAVSFTLAIKLPVAGGGLDTWNVVPRDLERLARLGRPIDLQGMTRTKPMIRHDYTVGAMAIQIAPILHRIGPSPRREPGDQRITLQGHGVLDDEGWVLYW